MPTPDAAVPSPPTGVLTAASSAAQQSRRLGRPLRQTATARHLAGFRPALNSLQVACASRAGNGRKVMAIRNAHRPSPKQVIYIAP